MKEQGHEMKLPKLDDLFTNQAQRDYEKAEKVEEIDISKISDFPNHPFKVNDDDKMEEMVKSIKQYGVILPVIVRPKDDGTYEMISGHRRKRACELAGITEIKAIVRDMTDEEAIIQMVDSNKQREKILPSEKAFAYKMKLDAIKHQGKASVQVAEKLLSVEKVADDAGESKDQVRRYIRLTYLIPELLSMVDENKIAFNPAVEISYLEQAEQRTLLDAMEQNDCTPSHAQAIRLKKLSQEGVLQDQTIYDILAEQKPNQQEQYKFKR